MKNGTEENGIPENSVLVSEDKDADKEGRYQSVNFLISSIGTIKSCLLVKPISFRFRSNRFQQISNSRNVTAA